LRRNKNDMAIGKRLKQLGGETLIYGLAGTLSRSIGILPSDYGIIAVITAVIGLLTTAIVMGLDNASARWYYDTTDEMRRMQVISSWFWVQFSLGLVVAALLFVFAPSISSLLLDSDAYAGLLRLAVLAVPISTAAKVLGNWLRYQRRAWMTTIFNLVTSLSTIGILVLFVVVWQWGMRGLFAGRFVAALLGAFVAVVVLRTWIAPWHVSPKLLREMLVFGLPLAPTGFASWVTESSDRFILKMFLPTSEIGLYALAVSLASVMALGTSAFQMSWGPFAYSIVNEEDAKTVYAKVFSIYSWVACAAATGLTLFAPLALQILTTPEYYAAASSVSYLAFSSVVIGATYIASLGSSIAKKAAPIAISVFISAGVNTVMNFALIPLLGRNGAALATLLAYLMGTIYLFKISQQHYYIPYKFHHAWLCLGVAWLLIAINALLPTQVLLADFVRAGMCLLFIPLGFWLGIVNRKQLQSLIGRITGNHSATY
jgi:O-antigen/teichoic acid export membrane protein